MSLRSPLPAPATRSLGSEAAMTLAVRELTRLGLQTTHRLAGFYAAPDARAEGADFAATVLPRCSGPLGGGEERGARLKVLIQCDGRVSVCPLASRCARPCKTASRCWGDFHDRAARMPSLHCEAQRRRCSIIQPSNCV